MVLQSNLPFIATLRLTRSENRLSPIPGRFFFSAIGKNYKNGPYIARQIDGKEGDPPNTMLLLDENYGDHWDVINIENVEP